MEGTLTACGEYQVPRSWFRGIDTAIDSTQGMPVGVDVVVGVAVGAAKIPIRTSGGWY
jgi:hypothetical protein